MRIPRLMRFFLTTSRRRAIQDQVADDTNDDDTAGEAKPGDDDDDKVAAKPSSENARIAQGASSPETPAREASAKENGVVADEHAPEEWDGFWPLSVDGLLGKFDRTSRFAAQAAQGEPPPSSHRILAELSNRNDIIGWNATIIRARRFPQYSSELTEQLAKLVQDPPRYNPDDTDLLNSSEDEQTNSPASSFERFSRDRANVSDSGRARSKEKPNAGIESRANRGDVGTVQISRAMQLAAAEAWCRLSAYSQVDPIDGLAEIGRLLEKPDLSVELRGELFRGVAPWVQPDAIPRLRNAFHTTDAETRAPVDIRRAAIEACLIHAWSRSSTSIDASEAQQPFDETTWPSTIMNCRFDPDGHVRRHFGQWLAAARHPQAFENLRIQLSDIDLRVRESALASLGQLGTDAALKELRLRVKSPKERVRVVALRGLAAWGADEVSRFVEDESIFVRQALATELAQHPGVNAAVPLAKLLADRNLIVQQAAIAAVREWPDGLAGPLLLQALRDSTLLVRRSAFEQFQRRFAVQSAFPFDAGYSERTQHVVDLARQHELSIGFLTQLDYKQAQVPQQSDQQRIVEIRSYVDAVRDFPPHSPQHVHAVERLLRIEPSELSIVEEHLIETSVGFNGIVFDELLPQLSPVYRALRDLHDADIARRRRAAQVLAQAGSSASLSQLVVRALRDRIQHEQDALVWRYAILAIQADATEESALIAQLAINHSWPDIRLRGCEYIGRHARPQHAVWLLPLLDDPNRNVKLAAIRACGSCRNPIVIDSRLPNAASSHPIGLRTLLTDPDRHIRTETIASLSRLGDEQGMLELMRLTSDINAAVRESAVLEMAQSGQMRFVQHLIKMAWIETNDGVKRAIVESLDELVPPEKRPSGVYEESSYDGKIRLWNAWWQESQRPASLHTTQPQTATTP